MEEMPAPVDGQSIAQSYMTLYFGEAAAKIKELEIHHGKKTAPAEVEPVTRLLGMLGKAISAEEFVWRMRTWDEAAIRMEAFHETYDLYMTPVNAMLQAEIGELDLTKKEELLIQLVSKLDAGKTLLKSGMIDQLIQQSLERTPFTQLANLTGQPAMSVPLYETAGNLPVGVQFMGARGREDMLIQLAAVLEQSDIWVDVHNNPFMKL